MSSSVTSTLFARDGREGAPASFIDDAVRAENQKMSHKHEDTRVIIIAPVGQDAAAMSALLYAEGFETHVCRQTDECVREIAAGAGVFLLTEEALELSGVLQLLDVLKAQPSWSELPVIILTSGGESRMAKLLDLATAAAGTITLLERPLSARTLVRSVQVALRSRRRQYEVRDLIARQQHEQQTSARLAAIVSFSSDAILSKTPEGIITSWNAAAERMFGYTAQEIIGQSIMRLIPADRQDEEDRILARLRMGEPIERYETVRLTKGGKALDVSLTISPIKDHMGRIIGASKIVHDISEQKRMERELRQAHELLASHAKHLERLVEQRTAELRDTVQQLETFSYSIVHDMRAPLRSMRSFAQILESDHGGQLDETGRNYLQRIKDSASRMDVLITDVLTYSRIAMKPTDMARVNLDKLISGIVEQYPQFHEAAANLQIEHPLPVVLGNSALLTQVFSNLLGNALKFVPPDRVPRVIVRAEEVGARARIWVEDNGIGVAREYWEKIFGLFQRLHGPTEFSGTGVGLAIVKKAIERMGGSVGLESEPGQGSRFWVELEAPGDRVLGLQK